MWHWIIQSGAPGAPDSAATMRDHGVPTAISKNLRPRMIMAILAWFLFIFPVQAQEIAGAPAEETSSALWQAPEIADLGVDWWKNFDTVSPGIANERLKIFLEKLEGRVQGLDPDNLVTAHNAIENLRSLIDLLEVVEQGPVDDQFDPVPAKEEYFLDELLALRKQWRELTALQSQTDLEIEQTSRQVELLRERRDSLTRKYGATDAKSPLRIIEGLNRVSARVEFQISNKRVENLQQRLKRIAQQAELLQSQFSFARAHLVTSDSSIEDVQAAVAEARSHIDETDERVATIQRQLLTVLSAQSVNNSLQLLRKQQLTRASADAALANLEYAIARSREDWFRAKTGQLESGYDFGTATSQARLLAEEIKGQVGVWTTASQTTLIASVPQGNLNTAKNFELAQATARDSLIVIEAIQDVSDDLEVMLDILATQIVDAQSGLGGAWARMKMGLGEFQVGAGRLLDFNLFDIGDAPVTPGGIFKMILIFVLAFGISWLIRNMLNRISGHEQFRKSPAVYTLGRLLHYIIIFVGFLVALGSIGVDFTSFALIAGALSVGIGFGLQAIVNNFVSGLILLFEGSLRVGDYIELDSGLAGVVKEINTRATVVNTNDAIDVVVPNSEFMTTKLTNWTLRESVGRVRIGFGVAYGSDKELVRQVALEAVKEMDFVLLHMPDREPQVRLVNFGDSALEFELLAWLNRQGVRRPQRVRASFLWALETKLKEAGIEIPFPQRDLHIRSNSSTLDKQPQKHATPDSDQLV